MMISKTDNSIVTNTTNNGVDDIVMNIIII
jgi:hypothetical protein